MAQWHRTFPWKGRDRKDWKCPCGWSYGFSVFEKKSVMPDDLEKKWKCPRCFPIGSHSD